MGDLVNDFVKNNIHMAGPQDDVTLVFNSMKKHKVRHIPVVEKGQAIGIISDRDLQFLNASGDSYGLKAKDIMTPSPCSVDAMTTIPHVVNIMATKKINSVLIHDERKKIVGIFTSSDALGILSEIYREKTEQLKEKKEDSFESESKEA